MILQQTKEEYQNFHHINRSHDQNMFAFQIIIIALDVMYRSIFEDIYKIKDQGGFASEKI